VHRNKRALSRMRFNHVMKNLSLSRKCHPHQERAVGKPHRRV